MAKIYISSTCKDLQKEREEAARYIRRLGHQSIAMEDSVASNQRPVDQCVGDVENCDVYVGIFAFRYGYIPDGFDKSITHLEYEAAVNAGIPCLIFLMDPKAPITAEYVDKGDEGKKIDQLRQFLEKKYTVGFFKTADELGGLVGAAVSRIIPLLQNRINDRNHFPKIPGYKIEGKLGKGGMATVYLGVQAKLKRQVAIKVLNPLLLEDVHFAKRFLREAEIAANLIHPHIITVYDVGQEGSHYYIVMELLTGSSLKDKLRQGALAPPVALACLRQMSSALDYAHQQGVIHRDIKSDNIMFRQDGIAILTDFGIARAVDTTTLLTELEGKFCTPKYMSPEQAKGEEVTHRSDIYSLGIVFYEMLMGRVPYTGNNGTAIAIKHIQEPVPVLPTHLSPYQRILAKMLAKEPAQRFQTAGELLIKMDGLITGTKKPEPFEPMKPPSGPSIIRIPLNSKPEVKRNRHPLLPWLVGACVLLVVIWIGVLINKNTNSSGDNKSKEKSSVPTLVAQTSPVEKSKPKTEPANEAKITNEMQKKNETYVLTVKGISYEMIEIPGGEFQMGLSGGDSDELPVHTVRVTGFRMGKTEVTQGLWQAVMGTNPSSFQKGDDYPVESVSWNECQAFISKLNQKTGGNYRLPTEAEWEYACRARTTGDYYGNVDDIAWYSNNSGGSTHPVAQKKPNDFGLHDMSGNVREWCLDWYDETYYVKSPINNPTGPTTGSARVLRGGGWDYFARHLRSAFRNGDAPGDRNRNLGFRLASGSAKGG